jgi:NitT/TauT family transport system substrate-binding protein
LYTSGSGETQQAVISGAVDVGAAVGTMGAMGAFTKGAPIRIIGAETTGGADYWYVVASSSIKTMKDTDGKTIAYSTNGASTHGVVMAFIKELNLKAKPVATGNPASTLTQVMTGQVDVGWGSPPFGIKEIDENKIRLHSRPICRLCAGKASAFSPPMRMRWQNAETRSPAISTPIARRSTTCIATIRR